MLRPTLKIWIATFFVAVFFLGCSASQFSLNNAKISPPDYMLDGGKEHFKMRLAQIEEQPVLEGGVLLAGDSITEGWIGVEHDFGVAVSNHGIGWDTVTGLRNRLPEMLRHNPDKVFILIGTNDIGYRRDVKIMASELKDIISAFQEDKPRAEIYIQSVMPREKESRSYVDEINKAYSLVSREQRATFIDLSPEFSTTDGTLRPELTYDGLHLNAIGYKVWASILEKYMDN